MGTKLNKEYYSKLIQENIDELNKYMPENSLEKSHIIDVLKDSINFYYPEKPSPVAIEPETKKPLSEITDEHGLKFIVLHPRYGGVKEIRGLRYKNNAFYFEFHTPDGFWLISTLYFDGETPVIAYQYLQSKGYELPVYFSPKKEEPVKDGFEKWLEKEISDYQNSISSIDTGKLIAFNEAINAYRKLSQQGENKEGENKEG